MSKQVIQDVARNTYHSYLYKMALSCGCEYSCSASAKIGDEAICNRCPVTIPAEKGLGVNRWPRKVA